MADVSPINRTDSLVNPFRPGNGVPPPFLAGRDGLLAEVERFLGDDAPGPYELDSDRDPPGAARCAERRPGRRATARARSRLPPVTRPGRRRAAAVLRRPPASGGSHTSIAGPIDRWPTGGRILRIASCRDASEHSGSMRRTTRARRHGTPAERSSIPSNAGLTRTGSCPPPSASAARTTPGGRTSPGWPDSVRSNGGHVGVARRSRSRIGRPAHVGTPRTDALRHASGALSPAEKVPSVSTAPGSARRAVDVRPPIRRASWSDPSALIYLGSRVAVTTDASAGLEASTGYVPLTCLGSRVAVSVDHNIALEASTGDGILPFSVLQREDFAVPRGAVVIVSQPQTITWAVSLVSFVIGERLATALSGT